MPILEAGLVGIPVFSSDTVPATDDIGAPDVIQFSHNAEPGQIADLILKWAEESPVLRLRRRVRQNLTWQSIFKRKILPLLDQGRS